MNNTHNLVRVEKWQDYVRSVGTLRVINVILAWKVSGFS